MINVDINIVGLSDQIIHTSLTVSTLRPTVKSALEALRDRNVRRDSFNFEERSHYSLSNKSDFSSKNAVTSITYRGRTLSALTNPVQVHEHQEWRFSVLRFAGNRSVLMQNYRDLPFDQFRIQERDQIFWALVNTVKAPAVVSLAAIDCERNTLIAV